MDDMDALDDLDVAADVVTADSASIQSRALGVTSERAAWDHLVSWYQAA
ncbi:MAG TPA: hypothetical protein VFX51_27670 [Solirubrobacteraceae bacterium]|nr:hypothetical protein [Solirubrobacteraceae bacterium]